MGSLCFHRGRIYLFSRSQAVIIIQRSLVSMPGQDDGVREPQTLLSPKSVSMGPLKQPPP